MKCKLCGNESVNENICDSCGLPFGKDSIGTISVEESVSVLKRIREDYLLPVDSMTDEIERLKRRKKNYDVSVGRHSFMRFYWPAFVFAFISFILLLIFPVPTIVALITPVLILIGWIFVAKKQENNANKALYEHDENNRKNSAKLYGEMTELNSKIDSKMKVINSLQWLIPKKYMNVKDINFMITELEKGKANSIEEAISVCSFVNK